MDFPQKKKQNSKADRRFFCGQSEQAVQVAGALGRPYRHDPKVMLTL